MAKQGIPYMGSKSKLATKILDVLKQRHPEIINFYDLFGGGGAISFNAVDYFPNVHYNEIDTSMVSLIDELQATGFNKEWWKPMFRYQFFELIKGTDALSGIAKTCWSFGNNYKKGYLYGANIEELKLSAHDFIINNTELKRNSFYAVSGINLPLFSDNSSFFDRRMIVKKAVKADVGDRFDLQSLESLQRLERLERLDSINQKEVILTNKSYCDVEIKDNALIYCDIPYKGTEKYSNDGFNHDAFYDWALSINVPVYISEYDMPSYFTKVASFSHRSTLSATNNSKQTNECIFWNGKGIINQHKLF